MAVASPVMFGSVAMMTSLHLAVGEALHELADAEVVGADAVDRAERAAEHVVEPAVLAGALDRGDVLRLLDDADRRAVPAGVAADAAAVLVRDVAAQRAEPHLLADLLQDLAEAA